MESMLLKLDQENKINSHNLESEAAVVINQPLETIFIGVYVSSCTACHYVW